MKNLFFTFLLVLLVVMVGLLYYFAFFYKGRTGTLPIPARTTSTTPPLQNDATAVQLPNDASSPLVKNAGIDYTFEGIVADITAQGSPDKSYLINLKSDDGQTVTKQFTINEKDVIVNKFFTNTKNPPISFSLSQIKSGDHISIHQHYDLKAGLSRKPVVSVTVLQ